MKASVIIPSYDQKHVIFDALTSVMRQRTSFEYEVIVVESTGDDTADLIEERFPEIRVIRLPQRAFPGTARNQAIKVARGDYLAFTDTDCIVHPDWLEQLLMSHERGYPVIGGMVKNGTPGDILGTCDYLLEFSDLIKPKETLDNTHFGTCNLSFSRDVFSEHGLFIDQVKGSDSLYCRQIERKGLALFYQPEAVIWHKNRTNLKKIMRNQYELGYGAAINRHRYHLKGKVFVNVPWLIPFLPGVRILAIGKRLLKNNLMLFAQFCLLFPLILTALLVYTAGFIKGREFALRG
ncbi:MAG: glycosyltransferase [candidate division KSB1 bacterium]|nr:glycosyltransferase [candidate division KSB1 bacterium]